MLRSILWALIIAQVGASSQSRVWQELALQSNVAALSDVLPVEDVVPVPTGAFWRGEVQGVEASV